MLMSRKPKQKQRKGTRMWKSSFHEASPLTVSTPPLIPETGSEASTYEGLIGNVMVTHSKCDLSDSCSSQGLLTPQRNRKHDSFLLSSKEMWDCGHVPNYLKKVTGVFKESSPQRE